ncbi:MAG: NUDIX hydrolase [Lachnospiraceae bacterium]|nr:NUDIX hydrolase [Lachnospiraceae bacterium]
MSGFRKITKQTNNRFLNMYRMEALNNEKQPFDYFFASRKEPDELVCMTDSKKPDGVLIYAICENDPEKIVMIRQYRYPLGRKIMELPAGLIDGDETPAECAMRELREETGMELSIYEGGSPLFRQPFFSAQGLTDECCSTVFGWARGEISNAMMENTEDIKPILVSKEDVKKLLETEQFSMRSAYLLMNFLRSDPKAPFAFLEI